MSIRTLVAALLIVFLAAAWIDDPGAYRLEPVVQVP